MKTIKKTINGKHYLTEYRWVSFDGVGQEFVQVDSRELTEDELMIEKITSIKKKDKTMNKKVKYNGKTYIETGDVFLYKFRRAWMSEYDLLTANEITIEKMDLKMLARYRRMIEDGKFFTPYKLNPNRGLK